MRNTPAARKKYMQALDKAMDGASDHRKAGLEFIAKLIKEDPKTKVLEDDLFAHYQAYCAGFSRSAATIKPNDPWWIGPLIGIFSGTLAVAFTSLLLSSCSPLLKLLVCIGVGVGLAVWVIYIRMQHFYRLTTFTSGVGILFSPLAPSYESGAYAHFFSGNLAGAWACFKSSSYGCWDICAMVIGFLLVLVTLMLPSIVPNVGRRI